jgi:5'-methylthioadenosine phosphorylase
MPEHLTIGVIGGGPLPVQWNKPYERLDVPTPHGTPSDQVARTRLDAGHVVYSLLRHGRQHGAGSAVNNLANVEALRSLGCDLVVSLSLAGSLSPRFDVGATVLYDDVIDFRKTAASFFSPTEGKHVAMAPLVEPALAEQLRAAAREVGVPYGGNMVVIEGPRYSTVAESQMFARLGGELICQTIAPECFLVREAGMAWFGCCLVTDLDVRDPNELVSTKRIFDNMRRFESSFAGHVLAVLERLRPFARPESDSGEVPRGQLTTFEG